MTRIRIILTTVFLTAVLAHGVPAWAQAEGARSAPLDSATPAVHLDLSRLGIVAAPAPLPRFGVESAASRQFANSWKERHRVLIGALVGFGVGTMAGLLSGPCRREPGAEDYCGVSVLLYGAAGAGLGAVIGYRITP